MLTEYVGAKSFFGGEPQLPLWSGYAIVLGLGAFFSVVTTAMVYLGICYDRAEHTSEYFNAAARTVKAGLTSAVIVSQGRSQLHQVRERDAEAGAGQAGGSRPSTPFQSSACWR